jgi:hypothetical protein
VVLIVVSLLERFDVLGQDDNVGDKDEEERDHGQESEGIEEEELGLGREGEHGQQGVRVVGLKS